MSQFSKRYGFQSDKPLQVQSMDKDLRTGLWNCICQHFWSFRKAVYNPSAEPRLMGRSMKGPLSKTIESLWTRHLRLPADEMPQKWNKQLEHLKNSYLACEWYGAYDYLEFLAPHADSITGTNTEKFTQCCNRALKEGRSAFRFVGSHITPITNEVEVKEVEIALNTPYDTVRVQILSAVEKLSQKPKPDLRNCIKESISAVETAVKLAADNPRGTLGKLLPTLKKKINLHSAQVEGFQKLYSYTSDDESGIRHGMMDKDDLTADDARYMLVTCSAFANYLLRLAERAGILTPPS